MLLKKSDMTSTDKKLVCRNLLETLIKVRTFMTSSHDIIKKRRSGLVRTRSELNQFR